MRVLREGLAEFLLDPGLVEADHGLPLGSRQFRVEVAAEARLAILEDFLEDLVVEAEHHVAIHLYEAAIAVIGEARIAGFGGKRLHRPVVETEVEDRVEHARHRRAGAGADRHQKQVCGIAETASRQRGDMVEGSRHVGFQRSRIGLAVLVIPGARLGRDRETRWNRQAEAAHLGQIGALAAKQVPVTGTALSRTVAEGVDPFGHARSRNFHLEGLRSPRSDRGRRRERQALPSLHRPYNRLRDFASSRACGHNQTGIEHTMNKEVSHARDRETGLS